jgi:peroxiredoxin
MALDIGAVAPDFTLPAHTGDNVTLSQYKGEKNVILSFHVYTFTGG